MMKGNKSMQVKLQNLKQYVIYTKKEGALVARWDEQNKMFFQIFFWGNKFFSMNDVNKFEAI